MTFTEEVEGTVPPPFEIFEKAYGKSLENSEGPQKSKEIIKDWQSERK